MAPAILDETPVASNGLDGVTKVKPINGLHNSNGVDVASEHFSVVRRPIPLSHGLPKFVPPQSLIEPGTISQVAQAFKHHDIINKHSFHQHECESIRSQHLDIKDDEYMKKVLGLKVTRDSHLAEFFSHRSQIITHLHSALTDSDKVLRGLVDFSEKLSIAEHDKELAQAEYAAANKARETLKHELHTVTIELETTRSRLIELVRERDAETVKYQEAINLVSIKEMEIEHLTSDVKELKAIVDKLTTDYTRAMDGWRKAEKEERIAKSNAERLFQDVTKLQNDKRRLEEIVNELEMNITRLQRQFAEVQKELAETKIIIRKFEKENERLKHDLDGAREDARKAKVAQAEAELLKEEAEKQRAEAEAAESKAKEQRNDAEEARKAAEDSKLRMIRQYEERLARYDDIEYQLKKETREKITLKEQRDHAIERASVACHYTQESIEWGQALNLINHQLYEQYESVQRQKIDAIEDKLAEQRERKILEGENAFARITLAELESERQRLYDEQRQTKASVDAINTQFEAAKAGLESEIAAMRDEVANVRVEQLSWEGERSQYLKSIKDKESAYEAVAGKNEELKNKLVDIELADAKLQKQYEQALEKQTAVKEEFDTKYQAEVQKRDAVERDLREKIVKDTLAHEDRERALKDEVDKAISEQNRLAKERDVQKAKLDEEYKKDSEKKVQEVLETVKRGHSAKHIFIQDIFYGGERLSEHNKWKDLYARIGAQYGSQEGLLLEQFFDHKEKKKPVVVVYFAHNDEQKTVHMLTTNSDAVLKFPKH